MSEVDGWETRESMVALGTKRGISSLLQRAVIPQLLWENVGLSVEDLI